MEGHQQSRAIKPLNMSRQQQLSIVDGLLTGHLGLYGHLHRIGKNINAEGVSTAMKLLNTCYVNVNL
jgi:hypothetical protein